MRKRSMLKTKKLSRKGGNPFRLSNLPVAIMFALAAVPGAVIAQDIEQVLVTGSRIRNTDGMQTPNPVTVVTLDELNVTAPTTLIEGLAELPQFYNSNTTENTGGFFTSAGAGSLNLRGLQGKRTLTLLSGRRVVSSTIYGGPDINMLPNDMLRSVETVTGGATAAYGTDAVAGVVNLILDTDYEGMKVNVQTGQNEKGDGANWELSLSGGFAISEKTHLLLSAEKAEQDPIWSRSGYDWYQGWGRIQNPSATAGQTPDNPIRLDYPNVVSRDSSLDGVIRFPGASGLGNWAVGPDGNATPFVTGSASDGLSHTITNGGSGTDNGVPQAQLMPESGRQNLFAFIDHDVTDNLTVFGQAMYGEGTFTNTNAGGYLHGPRSLTIFDGNPFLPANIQQMMTDNGIASVSMGRVGAEEDIAADAFTTQDTETTSITAGFDLDIDSDGFFNGWAVNGYFQTGTSDVEARQRGGTRLDRIYLAVDAVTGLDGQPACNVTVTSGNHPDCVPINLFGRGNASPAAVDWVTDFDPGIPVSVNGWLPNGESIPYSYVSSAEKKRIIELEQDVWEISANGEIFEGWGAGPVAMAIGYGQREESFVQYVQAPQGNTTADPSGRPVEANDPVQGIRGVPGADSNNSVEFQFSKVPFGRGDFEVKEAFTEFRVPLLSGKALVEQLNLDLAGRWANYSGSGDVWSWKAGVEWRLNDQLRLRGTVSQDARAATLAERYDRTGGITNPVDLLADPLGGVTYETLLVSGGNPNVRPEEGKTFTAGFVYQPEWREGLSFSLDWYKINVKDNINSFGAGNIVTGCYEDGDVDLCNLIERNGPAIVASNGSTINQISLVNDVFVNINSQLASGVDFELSYRTEVEWFGGGENLNLRLLGSYLNENSRTNSIGSKTVSQGQYGLPEMNYQISGGYIRGPLSANLAIRYTGETVQSLNNNDFEAGFNGGAIRYDVLNNDVESEVMVDFRVGYNFEVGDSTLNVYANINNLFDADPQASYGNLGGFTRSVGNGYVGDLRGRRYAVGARYEF